MLLQDLLRTGTTPDDLKAKYAIKWKQHAKYPRLHQFRYDQIESPMLEPVVRECRGVILDAWDDWAVVARPFDKFFNSGEGHAAVIDWPTAQVQEKLDGSMCLIYNIRERCGAYDHPHAGWEVATLGMPDAGGQLGDVKDRTFADLFWAVFEENWYEYPEDEGMTYMFELCSPFNRVIIPHKDSSLTLIGARHSASGNERPLERYGHLYEYVRSFPLQTLEDIEGTFKEMSPLKQEGYVVVDRFFNRIKVKHPGYVAIHHLKDGFGARRMVEIIRSGESSEVLTHFPEYADDMNDIQVRYDKLMADLENEYDSIKHIEDQKTFALQAQKSRCSGALFRVRSGHSASFRDYFAALPIQSAMRTLGLKDAEPMKMEAA